MKALRDSVLGFVILGGFIVCILAIVAAVTFGLAGVFRGESIMRWTDVFIRVAGVSGGVAILACLAGLVMHAFRNTGPRRSIPEARILARYAYWPDGTMLLNEDLELTPKTRTYVRMDLGGGEAEEFECPPEVFLAALEGTSGFAEVQGRRLVRYRAKVGT